jgi:hypothetical protein
LESEECALFESPHVVSKYQNIYQYFSKIPCKLPAPQEFEKI